MQYPQIQFYKGSLVRLAGGQLKQVEDLSSEDFIESAKIYMQRKNQATNLTTNNANSIKTNHQNTQIQIDTAVVRDFLQVQPGTNNIVNNNSNGNSPISNNSNNNGSCSNLNEDISPPIEDVCGISSVLIKFFLESSRCVVFREVSVEHPFFILHKGWSSWNPQLTFDKFNLKCRKLKIGDTCISLTTKNTPNTSLNNLALTSVSNANNNTDIATDLTNNNDSASSESQMAALAASAAFVMLLL